MLSNVLFVCLLNYKLSLIHAPATFFLVLCCHEYRLLRIRMVLSHILQHKANTFLALNNKVLCFRGYKMFQFRFMVRVKDIDQFWSCDCIVKETLWNRSEKVDHLACKYWCVLQGSGIIKMIRNLAQSS